LAVRAWPFSISTFSTASWISSTLGSWLPRSAARYSTTWSARLSAMFLSCPPTAWAALKMASEILRLSKLTISPLRFCTRSKYSWGPGAWRSDLSSMKLKRGASCPSPPACCGAAANGS